ncbi:MAG: hypothetical protein HKN23_11570 [Verrucomicrobiales bacterium]|nr:hypothetical protein [Verrucomicrobiales bacterium]
MDSASKDKPRTRATGSGDDLRVRDPRLAGPAFAVFLGCGVFSALLLHVEVVIAVMLTFLGMLAGVILLMASLVTGVRNPAPNSVRTCLWGLLGTVLVMTGTGLVYYFVVALDDPSFTLDIVGPFQALAAVSSLGNLAFYLIFLTCSLTIIGFGMMGLMNAKRWKKRLSDRSTVIAESSDG